MPTYEYRCVACAHQFERFQRMSDDPVTECEVCGQAVKRVLFPVAIHFKGSGFYSTDYGKRNTMSTAGTSGGGSPSSEQGTSGAGSDSGASSAAADNSGSADKPGEKSSGAKVATSPVSTIKTG